MRYKIYNKNGQLKAQSNALEYHGEWMGERYLTLSVKSSAPINLTVGDYILYRNERFELNIDPAVQKQAKINTYGEGFSYENIKFNSLTDELVRCNFFDCTSVNSVYTVGTSSKFSFYCATVTELAKRIQANLDRLYTGAKKWTIRIADGYTPTTDKEQNQSLSADNLNCWQALALAYEQMEVKFVVEKTSRTITIGTSGKVHNVMQFGKGKGLKKISKASKSDQNIITKVRAFGSQTNLPQHYYYYKVIHCVAPISTYVPTQSGLVRPNYFYIATPSGVSSTNMLFLIRNDAYETEAGAYTHTIKAYSDGTLYYEGTDTLSYDSECDGIKFANLYNRYPSKTNVTVEIVTCNKHYIPVSFKKSDITNEAQLIPVQNLMLPGYPGTTLDPYILSEKASTLGIREAVVYFDGSNDNDDIYPTIVGVTMKDLEDAGYTAYIATEDSSKAKKDIRIDAILDASRKPKNPISTAEDYFNNSLIDDDGIFDEESSFTDADGHFLVRIRNIGFDLASADIKLSGSEYPNLCMKDGLCGGREFSIVDCKESTDHKYYTLQCQRIKDDSLNQYFPNKNALIKAEDKFVLTNLNMPDLYIDTASARLNTAATAWLADNDTTTYDYSVELDNIYIARQHDGATSANSIHDNIKEGDVLWIKDSDLGIEELIEISNLTIKEGEDNIPEFSVTLNSEKNVGTIQKIQNAIKGIQDGSISVPGASVSQIKDIVNNAIKNLKLDETYLDKTKDDTAKGNYNFYGDIEFGDPTDTEKSYKQNLRGCKLYWNGSGWCVDTDYLNVNKKAVFTELEIQKVTHIGGQQILTACSCKIDHVTKSTGATTTYNLFFKNTDADGVAISNDWKIGDLAYMQTFNVGQGTTPNAGNRYIWARVISITKVNGTQTDIDGETFNGSDYHRIQFRYGTTIYTDAPAGNPTSPCCISGKSYCDTPKKGDEFIQLGHVKQYGETQEEAEARQGATLLAGAGKWGQALIMWRKISSFTMPDPDVIISPQKVNITADEMKLASNGVLELSSNQLLCTNKSGSKTAWMDSLGNFVTVGIQSQLLQRVDTGEKFLDDFVVACDKTIPPSLGSWGSEQEREDWKNDDSYYNENGQVTEGQSVILTGKFVSPISDTDYLELGSYGTAGMYASLDMRTASGLVVLDYVPKDNMVVSLPYMDLVDYSLDIRREEGSDFVDYYNNVPEYSVCRTPTRMNTDSLHFITLDEIKSLVGRRITILNESENSVHIKLCTQSDTDRVHLGKRCGVVLEFTDENCGTGTVTEFPDNLYSKKVEKSVPLTCYHFKVIEEIYDDSWWQITADNFGTDFVI